MRFLKVRRGPAIATALALSVLCLPAGGAAASPIYLCIGTKAAQGVKSGGTTGECPKPTEKVTYTAVALPSEPEEQQTLLSILPHISYEATGVDGQPTIKFYGVNVQVVSGSGSTSGPVNGRGNVVIGYDEGDSESKRTGSHNLILGELQSYSSYGSILGGSLNTASGPDSTVMGRGNEAAGEAATVTAGEGDKASGFASSVSGGDGNKASNTFASVTGGIFNTASGYSAAILGGRENTVSTEFGESP